MARVREINAVHPETGGTTVGCRAACPAFFSVLRGDGWKCRAPRPARRSSFRSHGKSTKARQAFPLHSLCSASAMTLLMLKLRIVHRRIVHTPVSAPLGADLLSFRAKRGISHSEACAIVDGDSSALSRLRMTGVFGIYRYAPTNHTHQRAEREIGAATMRIRATRTAVTINGQGFRHGKQITRAAALVFFLVPFSKVKKEPGGGDGIPALSSPAGRNPASHVPPSWPTRSASRAAR
jgi:hypothetical protein